MRFRGPHGSALVRAEAGTSPRKARTPRATSLPLRHAILEVASDYDQLTVRQLFYQLVSRGEVAKTEAAYKRVADAAVQVRLAGEMPFDKITDGSRSRRVLACYDNAREILEESASVYRQNYWASQPIHVEVWCEKDALSGVIEPICDEYGVTYVATRGFASVTLLYESLTAIRQTEKPAVIFFFGDHDASGRAIDTAIAQFFEDELGRYESDGIPQCEIRRVALEPDQIKKHGLPTRPGKETDSRNEGFRRRFGSARSVELDALAPNVLQGLVRKAIRSVIDKGEWARLEVVEEQERATLEAVLRAKGRLRRV